MKRIQVLRKVPLTILKPLITFVEARDGGYEALSGPYRRSERALLDRCVADMERGKVDYALVGIPASICVYRKGIVFAQEVKADLRLSYNKHPSVTVNGALPSDNQPPVTL